MEKNFTIRFRRFGFNIQFKRKAKTEFKIVFWAHKKIYWKRLKAMRENKK